MHADLNPKNLLVDPGTLEVTGVLDWEFAHAGSPWSDLGNLLRFDREPVLAEAVLAAYRAFMPTVPDDVLDRARAADLFALVELAARPEDVSEDGPDDGPDDHGPVVRSRELLAAVARTGDLHAVAP